MPGGRNGESDRTACRPFLSRAAMPALSGTLNIRGCSKGHAAEPDACARIVRRVCDAGGQAIFRGACEIIPTCGSIAVSVDACTPAWNDSVRSWATRGKRCRHLPRCVPRSLSKSVAAVIAANSASDESGLSWSCGNAAVPALEVRQRESHSCSECYRSTKARVVAWAHET